MAKQTKDKITQYAKDVINGKILAGTPVVNACKRHLKDLKRKDLFFSLDLANRAINFCEDVCILSGGYAGIPFKLNPWQCFVMGSLFGWLGKDKLRRFRTAYIETGKGSGKSPLAAAIGLYGLLADGEMHAEIYAAATHKAQAQVLFRDAVAMVDQSPILAEKVKKSGVGSLAWQLADLNTGGFFRVIASDSPQSGPRPHIVLLDEVHEHKNGDVIELLRAGTKSRKQALIVMITNSGNSLASVCYDYHKYGVDVACGVKNDDAFFSYICALDKDDDPFNDEKCWSKANPSLPFGKKGDKNLGIPGLRYLRESVVSARGLASAEAKVRRLNFCQWVESRNPWISGELWLKIEQDFNVLDIPQGAECFGGLDLSAKNDLTAFALYFPHERLAFVEFWRPQLGVSDAITTDKVPYDVWGKQNHINLCDGAMVDYVDVGLKIKELSDYFNIKKIAFDAWGIERASKEFSDLGLDVNFIAHPQGFMPSRKTGLWMSRSIELLERNIKENTIKVKFNPCLRWNASNVKLVTDGANNRKFYKQTGYGRIDGIVALAQAVGVAENTTQDFNLSAHVKKHGLRF